MSAGNFDSHKMIFECANESNMLPAAINHVFQLFLCRKVEVQILRGFLSEGKVQQKLNNINNAQI